MTVLSNATWALTAARKADRREVVVGLLSPVDAVGQLADVVTNSDWFPADYPEGRARFRCAAADAGSRLRSYVNPTVTGRHGEELATDVAVLGSNSPTSVLLITSGTHGVEGFCGSGCQDAFLEQRLYERLPRNAAAVLVHALNPYGYSWHRRVTEDNVDLNRNFIDFAAPLPLAPAYEGLHDALVPASWHGPERELADAKLREFLGIPWGPCSSGGRPAWAIPPADRPVLRGWRAHVVEQNSDANIGRCPGRRRADAVRARSSYGAR